MRVFLSFNSKDEAIAAALRAALVKLEPQTDIYFAPVTTLGQGFWLPKLANEIGTRDAFLLLLGPRGVGPWQEVEYHEAFARHVKNPSFAFVPVIVGVGQVPGLPFLRGLNWVEISDTFDNKSIHRVLAALKGDASPTMSPLWKLVHPYRGLEAMTETNADYFYGRRAETEAALAVLASKPGRLPILIGASGVGKSSVAQAGVLSALKVMRWPGQFADAKDAVPWPDAFHNSRTSWAWLSIQPRQDPLHELASAFTRLWIKDPTDPRRGPLARQWADGLRTQNTLSDLIQATQEQLELSDGAKPDRILLYLDQGEELYTGASRAAPKDASRFSEVLAEGLKNPCLIAFASLRADYFDRLQADSALFSIHELINVPPLSRSALTEVVKGPAEALGVRFEHPPMPERIVEAAAKEPGALPLLSYLLTDMWSAMVKRDEGILRLAEQAIDVGGVLAATAEKFLREHPAAVASLKRLLTLRLALVPPEGSPMRRQGRRSECSAEEWSLAEQLAEYPWRLTVIGEREPDEQPGGGDVTAEVAHEALLMAWPRLAGWLRDEREFLIFKGEAERAERRWQEMNRADKALLTGLDLARGEEWLQQRAEDLGGPLRAFMQRSIDVARAETDRRFRFQRRVSMAAVLTAMLMAAIGSIAWYQWRTAEHHRTEASFAQKHAEEARDQSLATQSLFLADLARQSVDEGDAGKAILLALEALPDASSGKGRPAVPEAEAALFKAYHELREKIVLKGHGSSVWTANFAPDGRRLITASEDHTARLWNAETGNQIEVLEGHTEPVRFATFSPDGQKVITASVDHTARLWSLNGNEPPVVLRGHDAAVKNAAFSADGGRVVTASTDHTARIWDVRTGKQLARLDQHANVVNVAAFSGDGEFVVTASDSARLWNARSGELIHEFDRHNDAVLAVAFDAKAKHLITGSRDKTARVWSIETREQIDVEEHSSAVLSVAFSPDGRLVATASEDWTVRLWNPHDHTRMPPLRGHNDVVTSALFSPDGRMLLTASHDRSARIWNVTTGMLEVVLKGHLGQVRNAVFSPDGMHILTASGDETARVWSLEPHMGKPSVIFRGHSGPVMQASFSPNRQFVVTASDDQTAIIWDAQTGKQRTILRGHLGPVRAAAFSPDGRRVATTSLDRTVRIWDTQNGDELIAIKEPIGEAQDALPFAATRLGGTNPIPPPARLPVVFSPDGLRFAAATRNGVAWVYDLETRRVIASSKAHVGEVYGISFVPNGNQIVTTGADRTIRLWDIKTTQQLARSVQSEDEHTNRIYNAAISPDGTQVVTVGDDDTPRLWNASTGSLKAVLRGHQGSGYGVAFSPDGKRIATTAHDDTVRIWDTEAGKTVAVLEHVGNVWSVAFSSDGEWIITASDDHIAQVWPVFSTLQRLIDKSKATVPRCLDHKQREDAFLDAMPPKWCVEQKKWPIGLVAN